ncbi:MAG: T9SS type A sorting domain-containing protein [Flavobacteriales bacterium]|nr:T9SS type A sorting domain-containing protein [Flavobacteriales bacterium]MCB0811867.1 T9SS type A sorting domain-containing protein [Flavobacteriales bacterium]
MTELELPFLVLRPVLFALAALLTSSGSAQFWCPPGATWHVSSGGLGGSGYTQYSYTGDTLFEGRISQQITATGYFTDYIVNPPMTSSVHDVRYTSLENDVVFLWTNMSGTMAWDTLYWFSAVPGDQWFPAGADNVCGPEPMDYMFLVTDTATVMIDGMPLRQLTVEPGAIQLTERMGSARLVFDEFPFCVVAEYGELIRCYSDQDISYQNPDWNDACDSGVGIDEERVVYTISVHPTPGHDRFTLEMPPGRHTLHVTDLAGRTVHTGPVETGIPVDASHWPAGTYVLRLPALGRWLRWVKE